MACGDPTSVLRTLDPAGGNLLFPAGKRRKATALQKLVGRGRTLLAAGNELFPDTLALAARGATAYGDLYRSETDKTRADELSGFERYGPRYVQAITAADPIRAATRDLVLENLDEGLDPALRREVQQGSRAAWASRGLAASPASAVDELLALGRSGKQLEETNLNRALQLIGQTDPFLAYAGRPSSPHGSNPMSPDYTQYSNDLPSWQANSEIQQYNAAQAAKQRQAQLQAAGISAAGSIIGGATSFI